LQRHLTAEGVSHVVHSSPGYTSGAASSPAPELQRLQGSISRNGFFSGQPASKPGRLDATPRSWSKCALHSGQSWHGELDADTSASSCAWLRTLHFQMLWAGLPFFAFTALL